MRKRAVQVTNNGAPPIHPSVTGGREDGMALVLTLMILVIITAMVTEFSYTVYTATSSLYNWKDSQRLSFVARSGVTLTVKTLIDMQNLLKYTYPGRVEMPVGDILDGFSGSVSISVEDEDGKFNLNSLVYENQVDNQAAIRVFRNLLKNQGLNEGIADRVADWIDRDSDPRVRDSEDGAKNAFMDSVDELLLINGIDQRAYERLLPYVTVYGPPNLISININTAPKPVIMAIYDNVEGTADKIIREREFKPFEEKGEFEARTGVTSTNIIFKSSRFRLRVMAEENRIRRLIESVVEIKGGSASVKYWKEI